MSWLMFPAVNKLRSLQLNYQTKGIFSYTNTHTPVLLALGPIPKGYPANHFLFTQSCYFKPFSHRLDSASSREKWLSLHKCIYKAEFDWKSSGYLTKRVIVCDEGRRGSGKNNGIPNIPSMLRLSLTAYIRISASNHLFCIYDVQKRLFDKRGTCTYEINIGKP